MDLLLVRDYAGPDCTLGTLALPTGEVLQALERPWREDPPWLCGKRDTSCLPAGKYALELHDSPLHPKTFCLVNHALQVYHLPADIPHGQLGGRTACLIHAGNYVTDVEGCAILGKERKLLAERWMITESRDSVAHFHAALPWIEGHTLTLQYKSGIAA